MLELIDCEVRGMDRLTGVVANVMDSGGVVLHASRVVIESQEHRDEHDRHHQAVLPQPQCRDTPYGLVAQDAEPVGDDNQRGFSDHRPGHFGDQVPGHAPEAHSEHLVGGCGCAG